MISIVAFLLGLSIVFPLFFLLDVHPLLVYFMGFAVGGLSQRFEEWVYSD